jgi:hypothetical protein
MFFGTAGPQTKAPAPSPAACVNDSEQLRNDIELRGETAPLWTMNGGGVRFVDNQAAIFLGGAAILSSGAMSAIHAKDTLVTITLGRPPPDEAYLKDMEIEVGMTRHGGRNAVNQAGMVESVGKSTSLVTSEESSPRLAPYP